MVAFNLTELAELLNARLRGDGKRSISGIASLTAAKPTDISFYTGQPGHRASLQKTRAAAVIIRAQDVNHCSMDTLVVDDPYLCYARASAAFTKSASKRSSAKDEAGIHPSAVVHENASIASDAVIGPHCHIGAGSSIGRGTQLVSAVFIGNDCVVGQNCYLDAGVCLRDDVRIGNDAIIHSNTVIGSDGFGFAWNTKDGHWEKIHQLGGVRIGNNVEIGAANTIDCGALDDTVIEDGVKTDNQIHIAHNVRIGAHTVCAASVAIGGSTTLGKRCRLGGCVSIINNLSIADDVEILVGSSVYRDIKKPGRYGGAPAYPIRDWRKNAIHLPRIHNLFSRVKTLENTVSFKD